MQKSPGCYQEKASYMKNKSKKILIADCQVFQEPAWHRGMGKYSLALLKHLLKNDSFSKIYDLHLLLNENLEKDPEVLKVVSEELDGAQIIWGDLPVYRNGQSLTRVQRKSKDSVNNLVGDLFEKEDVTFLIMSLFLQSACPVFPDNSNKILLYYDLIMLQYYRMYLGLGPSEQHFAHYKTVFESDKILSISKTAANDLTLYLGIMKEKIADIDGAPIKRKGITAKKPSINLEGNFILMPSGGDPRKNNHRAVMGFEDFNKSNGEKYKLILTSYFGKGMIKELNKISKNLIFTGNVEESELAWLYENCEAVLFAPEYEGLGMPILEAADYGKPVACSDISVFREISPTAFYYFDHESPISISNTLTEVFADVDFYSKKSEYKSILKDYSWESTAEKVLEVLTSSNKCDTNTIKKKKLAMVCSNIQISNYSGYLAALNYSKLMEEYEVEMFYDLEGGGEVLRPNHLAFVNEVNSLFNLDGDNMNEYERVLYFIEDDKNTPLIVAKALAIKGDIILLSESLKNVYVSLLNKKFISKNRLKAEEIISSEVKGLDYLVSLLKNSNKIFTDKGVAKAIKNNKTLLNIDQSKTYNLDIFGLPELPYNIPKSDLSKLTTVYISGNLADLNITNIVSSIDELDNVEIILSKNIPTQQKKKIIVEASYNEIYSDLTDFELINKLQKAKDVIIYTNYNFSEEYFISERCSQLAIPVRTVKV